LITFLHNSWAILATTQFPEFQKKIQRLLTEGNDKNKVLKIN